MRHRGFSLVELLIVVAIILVIAAIAVPNLISSRMQANEASAVAHIRTLSTAENTYAITYPDLGYTCSLPALGPSTDGSVSSTAAGIIDVVLAGGLRQGYSFAVASCSGTPVNSYRSTALPLQPGYSGKRAFCSNASGIIWYANDGLAATCNTEAFVLH